MAVSNHERVGKALDLLKVGLRPYFEREMRAAHGEKWLDEAASAFRDGRIPRDAKGAVNWDTHALLSVMAGQWNSVFSKKLGKAERNLVEELRSTRNDWAHQKVFSNDDTYRALDSVERLSRAIGAAHEVETVKALRLQALDDITTAQKGARATAPPTAKVSIPEHPIAADVRTRVATESVSGKYRPLHAHLMRVRGDVVTMTFDEIEKVLGDMLPPSAYRHRAWWSNEDPYKTVLRGKRAWLLAGFKAYPDMSSKRVTFRRGSPATRGEHR